MDTRTLYSETFKFMNVGIEQCSSEIQAFFHTLNSNRNVADIEFLGGLVEGIVSIRCIINVDIPSRGPVENIDIREAEPILILLDRSQYPYKAPYIFSDRIDFPYTKLPHMIVYDKYFMKGICLHRGNIDDWYSEHSIEDFITRIRAWFRDAASNRLIKDNDQFEPSRIEDEEGYIVYEAEYLANFIKKYWKNNSGEKDFGFFAFKINNNENEKDQFNMPSIDLIKLYQRSEYKKMVEDYKKATSTGNSLNFHLGIFVWCSSKFVNADYFGNLPERLDQLVVFGESIDCKVQQALNFYAQKLVNTIKGIPVICAVNRPKNLIGTEDNIEFINFVFHGIKKYKLGNFEYNLPVKVLTNRIPINSKYSRKLSNINCDTNPNIVVVGCGALGSKVSTHLSRCGYNKQFIVDNDKLQPHNIIRHSLFFDSVGINKAKAMVEKFNNFYEHDSEIGYNSSDKSIFELISTNFISKEKFDFVCDFSASPSVMNCLVNAGDKIPKVVKAEIGFGGKLGVMYLEGSQRNPGIDDIQSMLYYYANKVEEISKWLIDNKSQKEELSEAEFEEITIGLGCNSNTMRIADDVISHHAAIFSLKIRELIDYEDTHGKIMINYLDTDSFENSYTKILEVPSFISKISTCGEWNIKISEIVYGHIMDELHKHSPKETGGILIGHINVKKKTIYIFDTFTPEDSERYPYAFIRGIKDVPQYIKTIIKSSGGLIGYAGEWHTHPKMGLFMSEKDICSYDEIRENLRKVNLPTHIAIFNEKDFKCFIY